MSILKFPYFLLSKGGRGKVNNICKTYLCIGKWLAIKSEKGSVMDSIQGVDMIEKFE